MSSRKEILAEMVTEIVQSLDSETIEGIAAIIEAKQLAMELQPNVTPSGDANSLHRGMQPSSVNQTDESVHSHKTSNIGSAQQEEAKKDITSNESHLKKLEQVSFQEMNDGQEASSDINTEKDSAKGVFKKDSLGKNDSKSFPGTDEGEATKQEVTGGTDARGDSKDEGVATKKEVVIGADVKQDAFDKSGSEEKGLVPRNSGENVLDKTSKDERAKGNVSVLLRHCAYCLKEISDFKTCGQCKKRAYCGKECQKKDWNLTGQGHKNWCKIECLEEDVDWKVQEVPGKGLGVVALHDIPAKTRIMVDRAYTKEEAKNMPQAMDLHPKDGSFLTKFHLNCLASDIGSILCLRLSRVNHACVSNAAHWFEDDFKVKILFSEKDIKKGEEITFSYISHRSTQYSYTPSIVSSSLLNYRIVCPLDCPCNDPKVWQMVRETIELNGKLPAIFQTRSYSKLIKAVDRLIELYRVLEIGFLAKKILYTEAYQFLIMKEVSVSRGLQLLNEAKAIEECIEPYNKNSQIAKLFDKPWAHENYCVLKGQSDYF